MAVAFLCPSGGPFSRPLGWLLRPYRHRGPAGPVPGPAGPVRGPEQPGTAAEPDDIEFWYRRPLRRRRQRRLAIAAALITATAVTWTTAGGWLASTPQHLAGPPAPRAAPPPKAVIVHARARQHRRRQRIARTSAPFIGVGTGLAARYGRHWLRQTGHGKSGHRMTHHHGPPVAVGPGSFTTQNLFGQIDGDWNRSRTSAAHRSHAGALPSLDALAATTSRASPSGGSIVEKSGCEPIPRPNGPGDGAPGSGAGIPQLASFTTSRTSGQYCTDFATSPRPRVPGDPPYEPGGVAFVALAGDAVTWAVPSVNSYAPASLTPAQLTQIWSCDVPQANHGTAINQWGDLNPALAGSAATTPIAPFLPQSDSGTETFWLNTLGVAIPGPCVDSRNNTLEENEGVNPALNSPGVIFLYSVADYIDQRYHSAPCSAPAHPAAGTNRYGCDVHGTMALGEINGVAPTTGGGLATKINQAFPGTFRLTVYDVVPYDPHTRDHIPGGEPHAPGGVDLEPIFGADGWICTSQTARQDIRAYGFTTLPNCGSTN